ncbi:phosphate transporter (Pho88) [Polyrhizophydium stewartii]|uniref:Phosphate transporter (Pho88) n=1 Tax=Polyrhizophydium stewartii TaxID=2732419 RepID=A0ABR4NHU1_9FUNG|nr:hypothetical protein HK105_006516 [Polyrhizophydium stewartii]
MSSLNQTFINIGIVLAAVQVANYFKLDAPENTLYIRIAYAASQAAVFACIAYIYTRIRAKKDKTELIYNESKFPFSSTPPETIRSTVGAYDEEQVRSLVTQNLTTVAVLLFITFRFGYLRPLVIQSVMALRQISTTPLFRVHILGEAATGDLARPWKGTGTSSQTPGPTKKELKAKERKEAKKRLNRLD